MTSRFRLFVRLARRSLASQRRRSVLLTLLLAVPLAAAAAVSTLLSMATPRVEQVAAHDLGAAQYRVVIPATDRPTLRQTLDQGTTLVAQAIPPTEHAEPEVQFPLSLTANDRLVLAAAHGMDSSSPLHTGRFRVVAGRLPDRSGEVALSDAAAQRLSVGVDGTVRAEGAGAEAGVELRVVGLIRDPFATDRLIGVVPLASALEVAPTDMGRVNVSWLTNARPGPVDGQWGVTARASLKPFADGNAIDIGGFALGVLGALFAFIVIVAGVAFALIAAEQRREIGQLASVGAPRWQRQASLAANGLVIGSAAAVGGIAAGLTIAAGAAPVIASQFRQDWGDLRPDWLSLFGILVVGLLSTSVAAWVAGHRVSAMPALDALRLRPEPAKVSRASQLWTVSFLIVAMSAAAGAHLTSNLGLVLMAAAAALAAVTTAILASSQWLNDRAAQLGLAPRLALRLHLAAPGRAAAITTVVATATSIAGIVLVGVGGLTNRAVATYVPAVPSGSAVVEAYTQLPQRLVDAVSTELAAETNVKVNYAIRDPMQPGLAFQHGRSSAPPSYAGIVAADGLERILGIGLSAEQRAAFDRGAVVTDDPGLVHDGFVKPYEFPRRPGQIVAPEGTATPSQMDAILVAVPARYSALPRAFLSPSGAAAAGYGPSDQATYYLFADTLPTLLQEDAARAILNGSTNDATIMVERGPPAATGVRTVYTVAAIGLVTMILLISVISVTLASGELRAELGTLASVGAHRRFRRRLNASLGAVTSALGILSSLLVVAIVTPAQLTAMNVEWTATPWLLLGACGALAIVMSTVAGYALSPRPPALTRRAE